MSEALSAEMRRCGAFEWAAKLEALEEKVQYAANAATDLARQLRVAEARIEALERKQSELREAGDWLCSYVRGYREESAKLAVRRWEALAAEEKRP